MKKEEKMPNFIELENDISKFWEESEVFKKMMKKNENSKKRYRFLDGPATANYQLGMHHLWGRTLKDLFLKYKSMQGFSAEFKNGFDAHGLPVELGVEKELGINSKKEIMDFGLDNFVEACMKRVDNFAKIQTSQSKRLGQLMDWDNSYYTNSDENIKAIWAFLKKCDEKGWIVKDHKPMQWCPRCGTSLSEHEMTGSYKEVEHMAVYLKLPILNSNDCMLVWTTTPWTLSSNVAIAVNPRLMYVRCRVKSTDKTLILGKESLKVLKDDLISVIEEFKGDALIGKKYETCFPELSAQNFVHEIVGWEEVSATDGVGAVHIAPGCGGEDFELGVKLNLPKIMPIDENGVFYPEFGFLAEKKANEVKELVFDRLKQENKLYFTHKFKHSYPICWRCKEEIVFRLADSWYILVDELRPLLLEANKTVKWEPEFMGKRMADWLTNMTNWNIARKRFYGLPLPIYPCSCGHVHVVGSTEELAKLSSEKEVQALPHLHRPYIDNIKINCPVCGKKVDRIPDVGDCWLDAGITSFSTKKYFEDKTYFNENFPNDVVIEMREQVRLWFYSLLVMSVVMEGKAPYEKVVAHESVVKEDGSRYSKSGVSIEVIEGLDKAGADATRYLYAGSVLTSDMRFGFSLLDESRRKIINFWNNYSFFNTYACIDKPNFESFKVDENNLDITDKWLLSRTESFIFESEKNYNEFKAFNVVKDFEKLVDDVSNFYIRANRRRFWKSEDGDDKLAAYYSLYKNLKACVLVMAPIIPFLSEYLWQNMVKSFESDEADSVLVASFPKFNESHICEEVNWGANNARQIIAIALKLRNENQLKIKQPLKTLFLNIAEDVFESIENFEEIIKAELNIKDIVFEKNSTKFNEEFLTVDFKTAGAVLKGEVQNVKNALANFSKEEMQTAVQGFKDGNVNIGEYKNLSGDLFVLNFKPKIEYVVGTENGFTVVLDTTIDECLMLEGLYRELVRQIQVLRKQANFLIEERIYLSFETESETISKVLKTFSEKIKEEVLAYGILIEVKSEICEEVIVGDDKVKISLTRNKE